MCGPVPIAPKIISSSSRSSRMMFSSSLGSKGRQVTKDTQGMLDWSDMLQRGFLLRIMIIDINLYVRFGLYTRAWGSGLCVGPLLRYTCRSSQKQKKPLVPGMLKIWKIRISVTGLTLKVFQQEKIVLPVWKQLLQSCFLQSFCKFWWHVIGCGNPLVIYRK